MLSINFHGDDGFTGSARQHSEIRRVWKEKASAERRVEFYHTKALSVECRCASVEKWCIKAAVHCTFNAEFNI